MIEGLYKRKLLEKSHVITFANFTGTQEADIEDMFDEEYYLALVNGESRSPSEQAHRDLGQEPGSPGCRPPQGPLRGQPHEGRRTIRSHYDPHAT